MAAAARVALALMVVTALAVATCSAKEVGLYIHLQDSKNVVVFEPASGSANVIVPGFGVGRVFDYPVTSLPTGDAPVVARAQGLYYHASNEAQLESFQEQFTILFQDANSGEYSGTSFTFGGVWASGYAKEFFILGGSGHLKGLQGTVTLVRASSAEGSNVYSLDVEDARFESFLANRVLNTFRA